MKSISYASLRLNGGGTWAGDLEHDLVPDEVAIFFAKNGDLGQRYGVASNERTPQFILRGLLEDPEPGVWGSVIVNRATSTETLEIAASLHPGSESVINNHLNASMKRMRSLRGIRVFGSQFQVFFERVKATESEQVLLHKAIDDLGDRATLGAAWDAVRSSTDNE